MNWSKTYSKSSGKCYNLQECKITDTISRKGRYVSPIRIKNKKLCSSQQQQCSTPIGYNNLNDFDIGQRMTLPNHNYQYNNSGMIPYREKRNPLGGNIRLSCYKPQNEIITSNNNSNNSDDKMKPNLCHYKSVDDIMLLNISSNGNDNRGFGGSRSGGGGCDTISLSSTSDRCSVYSGDISSYHMKTVMNEKQSDLLIPKNDDLTYGFSKLRSKSIDTTLADDRCDYDNDNDNDDDGDSVVVNDTKLKIRKDLSSLSNKIKAMSDRTHKLFSKLYLNSQPSTPTLNKPALIDRSRQKQQQQHRMNKNQRSFSYGSLPGVDDFSSNNRSRLSEKKIIQIQDDNDNDETATSTIISPTIVNDTEDGDSGILVNESGASSMQLETDDFLFCQNETNFNQPILHTKKSNDLKEFKLIRLQIEQAEDSDFGFLIAQIKNIDEQESNCRYEVAHIISGGLADR